MTAGQDTAPPETLALVRVGAFQLAVDSQLVQSVVPGPLAITPFPRAVAHVPGAFAWRGLSMPLLDIHALLAPSASRAAGDVPDVRLAMILRSSIGCFAMPIDRIGEVVRATPASLTELDVHSPQGAGIFRRLHADREGTVHVVLDLEAILAIDDLRAGLRDIAAARGAARTDTDAGRPHMLVRAGSATFALDARSVRHVERRTATERFALHHPSLRGFHTLRDRTLAVVDLLSLLELPPSERPTRESHLLVVGDSAHHDVALVVDEIVAVSKLATDDLQPLPDAAGRTAALYAGSTTSDAHGTLLVLEPEALLQAAAVVDPSVFRQADAARQAATAQRRAPRALHMVYRAGGGSLASRLIELDAIIRLPATFTDLRREGSPLVGLCEHGGDTVPVLDLSQLMGRAPVADVADRPVLVVRHADGRCGLLVEQLLFLQDAAPVAMPGHGRPPRGVLPALTEMIRARRDGADYSAAVLPLAEVDFGAVDAMGLQATA